MLMLRPNRKANKVLYSLIGIPAPFAKQRMSEKEKKVNDRLASELRTRIK